MAEQENEHDLTQTPSFRTIKPFPKYTMKKMFNTLGCNPAQQAFSENENYAKLRCLGK